jgi:hypothetical protein
MRMVTTAQGDQVAPENELDDRVLGELIRIKVIESGKLSGLPEGFTAQWEGNQASYGTIGTYQVGCVGEESGIFALSPTLDVIVIADD